MLGFKEGLGGYKEPFPSYKQLVFGGFEQWFCWIPKKSLSNIINWFVDRPLDGYTTDPRGKRTCRRAREIYSIKPNYGAYHLGPVVPCSGPDGA